VVHEFETCTALRAPAWDLAIVLEGLALAPFEPFEEVSEKFLTLKTFLPAVSFTGD